MSTSREPDPWEQPRPRPPAPRKPGYDARYEPGYGLPPSAPPGYQRHRAVNGFAITSLVLGILWLWWVGSILALVFGYLGRRQIRERGQEGAGLAIAGIVLGWIGVATLIWFIVLLAAFRQ